MWRGNVGADVRRDWMKKAGQPLGDVAIVTLDMEQALALLANADRSDVGQQLLAAHGFGVPTIAGSLTTALRRFYPYRSACTASRPTSVDDEIRGVVARNWPHLLSKLPPEED
jgi:hypothetical protein